MAGEEGGKTQRRVKRKKQKESKADEKDVISLVAVGAHLRPFASGLKPAAESISAMYNDRLSQQHGRWPAGKMTALSLLRKDETLATCNSPRSVPSFLPAAWLNGTFEGSKSTKLCLITLQEPNV